MVVDSGFCGVVLQRSNDGVTTKASFVLRADGCVGVQDALSAGFFLRPQISRTFLNRLSSSCGLYVATMGPLARLTGPRAEPMKVCHCP